MAVQNLLIMNLLRIITPEEIADIATKHNGGKFLSLTDLVNERVDKKIYRNFTSSDSINEIHEEHANHQLSEIEGSAKILPFNKLENNQVLHDAEENNSDESAPTLKTQVKATSQLKPAYEEEKNVEVVHRPDENMSSFILIEKARLKQSQKSLKQKEIINLYQKNSNIDVEQIKSTNQSPSTTSEAGVLVNKKQY